jgi:3-oxoadipate enol-lactonase
VVATASVLVLDGKSGSGDAGKERREKECTHGQNLGTSDVERACAPLQMSKGLTVAPAHPFLAKAASAVHVAAMAATLTAQGRIGLLEQGSGDRTPIVFLHGVGSDKSVWRPQLDHFGTSRRAIAFDYPGYGESDLREHATRDDYAAAILAAMDALGIAKAHVCGLSLGGVIAIALHAAAPERCASLIIADSFAVHPQGEAIYERGIAASHGGMRALAEARIGALLASEDEDVRADVIETMGRIDPAAYRIGAKAVWLADQRDRAAAIRVPTLVIVGDEDAITPPALSEELAAIIPGAKLQVMAGASHLANLDNPAQFNAVIDDFLSAIGA